MGETDERWYDDVFMFWITVLKCRVGHNISSRWSALWGV